MKKIILLIDSNPKSSFMLDMKLSMHENTHVISMTRVENAVRQHAQKSFDLILYVDTIQASTKDLLTIKETWCNTEIIKLILMKDHQKSVTTRMHIEDILHLFFYAREKTEFNFWYKENLNPILTRLFSNTHSVEEVDTFYNQNSSCIVVVASSTGGPTILRQFILSLPDEFKTPILIAQHIPKMFDRSLCDTLNAMTSRNVVLAENNQAIEDNTIYIAPFDYHMEVDFLLEQASIRLTKGPKEHFLRPAADPLFRSVSSLYRERTIGVILSGMGEDGVEGGRAIKKHKGTILCQDKETSIVWGMPAMAVQAGIDDDVVPITQMGTKINEIVKRKSSL